MLTIATPEAKQCRQQPLSAVCHPFLGFQLPTFGP